MLTSLALIFLLGLLLGSIFVKLKLPSILGMILTGIILGPHALNLLRPASLDISTDLRQLALVIILTRAGLTLDMREFKRIGRSALMMCFVPASVEIVGVVLLAPPLMGVTYWEAALMGSAIAAVSPAVVVPRMLKMRDKKAIARDFGINADTFETWLKSLNFVRNVCAHHGRLWNRHLAIAPGIPNKDPRWHEKRYPIVPHRIYSVLCILKQLIDVIAPQSRWPERLKGLLAEFPGIHRLSMALPTGFEHSLIWR